jgi:hypothetical protein
MFRKFGWKVRLFIYNNIKLKLYKILKKPLNLCQGAQGPCFRRGKRRRQYTAYVKDELNWVFMCDECARINDEYWQEMWQDYYNVVGGY